MVGTLGSSGLIGLAWVLLLICFFLMPPPTPDPGLTPVNINYVWGLSDNSAQPWVPPYVWFAGLLIGLPLLVFAPTHFVLARMMPGQGPKPIGGSALRGPQGIGQEDCDDDEARSS